MNFKLQDYHEGFFHPTHIKISSVILLFWTEIFHNAHLIICILFEKFGGDPMKRTVNNQLQVQICYAFLLNNIFYTPVYIWRIFIGSIHPLFASVASYIYQIYLSWILLAFTEMSVIKTFTLLKWSFVCGMDELFMGQFLWISNLLYIFLSQTGRYLQGNMHMALDFQLLTGKGLFINYVRMTFLTHPLTLVCKLW